MPTNYLPGTNVALQSCIVDDTYATVTSGKILGLNKAAYPTPVSEFSLQVVASTGNVTAWSVVLEGGNDGVNFQVLLTHSNTDTSGAVKFSGGGFSPVLFMRTRVVSATGLSATDTLRAIGVGSQ